MSPRPGRTLTTDGQGRCEFDGLPLGTYYVRENDAPEGYRLPSDPVAGPYAVTGANAARPVVVRLTNEQVPTPKPMK